MFLQTIANQPNWAEIVQAYSSIASIIGFALVLVTLWMQQTTLILQQKHLSEQQKITELEQKRYLAEIKPRIKAEVNWKSSGLYIWIEHTPLLNAETSVIKLSSLVELSFEGKKLSMVPVLNTALLYPFKVDPKATHKESLFILRFKFEDEIGTKYTADIQVFNQINPLYAIFKDHIEHFST